MHLVNRKVSSLLAFVLPARIRVGRILGRNLDTILQVKHSSHSSPENTETSHHPMLEPETIIQWGLPRVQGRRTANLPDEVPGFHVAFEKDRW